MAPEILQNEYYDTQVDVWSMGVMLYIMLSGHMPFSSKKQHELVEKIVQGKYNLSHKEFRSVSSEGKDLINKMLVVDPKVRLTAAQVLKHPWFAKFHPDKDIEDNVDKLDAGIFDKLRKY
jgi:calcium/calmodulin-dependent protein kinase I